jgi:hypothetical protein
MRRSWPAIAAGPLRFALPMLCALAALAAAPAYARIMFAADTPVPRPVQVFAWHVIETRCQYQRFELDQRSFWAFATQVKGVGGSPAYSISILSDLTWKKTEPPAIIQMTIVDGAGMRLTALQSSFVVCVPEHDASGRRSQMRGPSPWH